jgi:hypothetical protein
MASNDLEKFVQSVSVWIDSSLTMMGEMYKRNTQRNSFWIGLAMAISFNLDTVSITNHLYRDKEARETIAAYATDFGNKVKDDVIAKCNSLTEDAPDCKAVDELRQGLLRRSGTFGKLPIGWGEGISAFSPTAVPGWLLTALAISLGAPFWFDLLNRLINIRHGMKRPTVSKEEGKP